MNCNTQYNQRKAKSNQQATVICVSIALCTIVAHNTAQKRPDNFPITFQTIIIAQMMSI